MPWRSITRRRRQLYAGTNGGGVFQTFNGGGSWTSVNSGLTNIVYALAVDPGTPATAYAGTFDGGGVFKTINAGTTWTAVNVGLTYLHIFSLAIDPATTTTIYAGTFPGAGVFKSVNGGASWIAVNNGLPAGQDVNALAIDPATTATVYAGMGGGVFKSVNGGGKLDGDEHRFDDNEIPMPWRSILDAGDGVRRDCSAAESSRASTGAEIGPRSTPA